MRNIFINRAIPSALAFVAVAGLPFSSIAQEAAPAEPQATPAEEEPTLVAGADVPSIDLEGIEWIKGEPVTSLNEDGKVYMIECWATWCGPCITAIPHINELHTKFADKGLVVVGMNVFEDGLDKVKAFASEQGEAMSYRVAYSGGRDSVFAKKWLEAAGVKGIPHAFFVKNGKLLFTSHPANVDDELVSKMLGDNFDPEAFAAEQKAEQERLQMIQQKVGPLMQAGDWVAVKEFANTELDDEKDKDIKTRILTMVATQEGDWAAIQTFAEAADSDDEREMMFGSAAFSVDKNEGGEEAAKVALAIFTEAKLAEAESIKERVMPGLVRARYLSMTGDKEAATALLKTLSTDAAASDDEDFKNQLNPILEKAIAASEAGTLGSISSLMR